MCLLALLAVQVLSIKASAKRRLQAQYGLATGEQYSVATFVGRMTQQKGCDVIAEVAAALMAQTPTPADYRAGPIRCAVVQHVHYPAMKFFRMLPQYHDGLIQSACFVQGW
jgi:hypothetical protein